MSPITTLGYLYTSIDTFASFFVWHAETSDLGHLEHGFRHASRGTIQHKGIISKKSARQAMSYNSQQQSEQITK